MNLNNLIFNELTDADEIYIYGYGIAGKWFFDNLPNKESLKCFIDTDQKKSGISDLGVPIKTPQQLPDTLGPNAAIIITVIDIQDVIDIVKKMKCKKVIPLGLYLDELDVSTYENNTGESIPFLKYSLEAVRSCHQGYFSENELFLRSVDLVITEKCSLKCKDCSNLMQYYEKPVDVGIDEISRDFEVLASNVNHIFEVRLIGGEPFMNKDIYKILDYLYSVPNVSKIVVYSNAMIPIKPEFQKLLTHEKLVFSLTDYGNLAKNTPKVVAQLEALGASYRLHPPENWTDSGQIYDFKRTDPEMVSLFESCCGKNLLTLSEGKLYRCPFSANADRLHAIPDDSRNYVSVDSSPENIRRFTREINYIPACNHCKGRSYDSPSIVPAIQALKPLDYVRLERIL